MALTEFNPFEVLNRTQDFADLQTAGTIYVYFEVGRMKGQWASIDKLEHKYTKDRCWRTYFSFTTLSGKTGRFSERYNAKWYVGELDEKIIESMTARDFFGRKLEIGSPVVTIDCSYHMVAGTIKSIDNRQLVVGIVKLTDKEKTATVKVLDQDCYLIDSKEMIKTIVTAKLKQ